MKCPKCHYLSFEPEPRCKNCGYDLELGDDLVLKTAEGSVEGPLADLALRDLEPHKRAPITLGQIHAASPDEAADPPRAVDPALVVERREDAPDSAPSRVVATLAPHLTKPAAPAVASPVPAFLSPSSAAAPSRPAPAAPPVPPPAPPAAPRAASPFAHVPRSAAAPRREAPRSPSTTSELPLFVKGLASDRLVASVPAPPPAPRAETVVPFASPASPASTAVLERDVPLVKVPAEPRQPLSVRRGAPEISRGRAGAVARPVGPLDRDLLEDLQRVEKEQARLRARVQTAADARDALANDDAGAAARLGAASIDGLILGSIGSIVIYFTLRLCGLTIREITTLPMIPLAVFLLLVTFGYLLLFTIAGGQTLGKMVMGIRVVGASPGQENGTVLTIRQAAYRELLSVPLVAALGAGLIPALVGRGQAVHDRLAETRVVRA